MTEKSSDKASEQDAHDVDDVVANPVTPEPPQTSATSEDDRPGPKPRLTKAERLEARASRLREAEAARAVATSVDGAGRGWRTASMLLAIATAALLALSVVLFLSWRSQGNDATQLRGAVADQQTVLKLAAQYATDFGSYDYRHLSSDFAKVATHLTAQFKRSYLDSSSRLEPTIIQYKGMSVATVQGTGLSSASHDTAVVIVLLDQAVTTSQSSTPRIDRNRLAMTLVRQDGTWLIAKLATK